MQTPSYWLLQRPATILVYSRNFRSVNIDDFTSGLSYSDFFKSWHDLDVSALVESHNSTLTPLLQFDNYPPLKQRSILVHPLSPWFTADIVQAKIEKEKASGETMAQY